MNANAIFNCAEAGLWIGISVWLLVAALRRRSVYRPVTLVAAAAFFVFGISDLIEARTGSWWNPPWLFFLKGACVLCFLGCIIRYRAIRRAVAARRNAESPDATES